MSSNSLPAEDAGADKTVGSSPCFLCLVTLSVKKAGRMKKEKFF
jgi:hypothetical protein